MIRYITHTSEAGFAVESRIVLEPIRDGTIVSVVAYVVGESVVPIKSGAFGFARDLTKKCLIASPRFVINRRKWATTGRPAQTTTPTSKPNDQAGPLRHREAHRASTSRG